MKPDFKFINKIVETIAIIVVTIFFFGYLILEYFLDKPILAKWVKDIGFIFVLLGIIWSLCHKKIEIIINRKYKIKNNEARF